MGAIAGGIILAAIIIGVAIFMYVHARNVDQAGHDADCVVHPQSSGC